MLGKEIKVQHSSQQINHIQLHSGKYKDIYISMSYVTRRLLTVVENISHHLSFLLTLLFKYNQFFNSWTWTINVKCLWTCAVFKL